MRKIKGGYKGEEPPSYPKVGDIVSFGEENYNVIEVISEDWVKISNNDFKNVKDLTLVSRVDTPPPSPPSLSNITASSSFGENAETISPGSPGSPTTTIGSRSPMFEFNTNFDDSLSSSGILSPESTNTTRGGKKTKRRKKRRTGMFTKANVTAGVVAASLLNTEVEPDLSDNVEGGKKTKRKSRSRKKPYSLKKRIR
jgi:hypothetical protein